MAAFLTDDYEKAPGVVVPQYAGYGEMFAAGMSVLFGKRFDAHGSLQNDGIFNLPDPQRVLDLHRSGSRRRTTTVRARPFLSC
ncbi:hypothetical protein ACRAWD_05255 [Caulobacter segnis]